jgi:hypothetical protein
MSRTERPFHTMLLRVGEPSAFSSIAILRSDVPRATSV